MKVIFLKDTDRLGKEGDIKDVKDGFARNYLFPRGFACQATVANVRKAEDVKKRIQLKRDKIIKEAENLKKKLNRISVTIETKAGEDGKLFGTVTTEDIMQNLKEQQDIEIDRHQIVLQEPIKQLGIYKVDVHLIENIKAELKVWIVQTQ